MEEMNKTTIEENYEINNKDSLDKIANLLDCSKNLGVSLVQYVIYKDWPIPEEIRKDYHDKKIINDFHDNSNELPLDISYGKTRPKRN